jgi:phage protein D
MTVSAIANTIFDPGGLRARKQVNTVKVMMTEGMHDTAIIRLRGERTDLPELQPGTPVQMQYGWNPSDTDWFYGYVDHVETCYHRSLPDQSSFEDVVCMGTSYALKDPFTGAWSQVQASTLAQLVASTYFLGSVIENDDYFWPQLSNPGISAWQFLIQLANKNGYTLAVNKTLLRFMSVDVAVRAYGPNMPVFKTRNTAPSVAFQGISEFHAVTGESFTTPGATSAVRTVSGMDVHSGTIVGAINDGNETTILGSTSVYPFFSQQVSDQVVISQGTAQNTLAGLAEANRFNYQATATLVGKTSVHQGTPIVLNGIDSVNDGVWWVQEVIHKISTVGYSMDVTLGRDSKGDSGMRPINGTAVGFAPSNPLAYTVVNAPPTKLVNNRWRASHQFNVNVS